MCWVFQRRAVCVLWGMGEVLTALSCPGLLCSNLPSPVQSHFALPHPPCPTLSHPTVEMDPAVTLPQVTCYSLNERCQLKVRSNTCYCCDLYACGR